MSDANLTFVQDLYAAYAKGDIATLLSNMTPDVEWHSGGRATDYPAFGLRKGHAQVQEFFKIVAENNDFSRFTPREFYAVADKVFVLGDYALTLRRTGRSMQSDWAHVFTIRDGKVAGFREFLDTAQAAEAYRQD